MTNKNSSSLNVTTATATATGEEGKDHDDSMSYRVAVFHRKDTMPTFPSHWAGISGSIEQGETPWETARRELFEETNLGELLHAPASSALPEKQYGLYVDVPYVRKRKQWSDNPSEDEFMFNEETIVIRVYPFVVHISSEQATDLELRGTEHDTLKWLSLQEFEQLSPTVPALVTAFHHATFGRFLKVLSPQAREWESDRVSGAASMAQTAVADLIAKGHALPSQLKMLRPSMVAITNLMKYLEDKIEKDRGGERAGATKIASYVLEQLERDGARAIDLAVQRILAKIHEHAIDKEVNEIDFTIALFSRSSTLRKIMEQVRKESTQKIIICCSKSTPGDEGILMAQDLDDALCVEDGELISMVKKGDFNLILVGSDCIMQDSIVNKVGTAALAMAAKARSLSGRKCAVFCCSDRWKVWDDIFPPPMEDIFESVPCDLFDEILVPEPIDDV